MKETKARTRAGAVSGASAFLIWGLSPVYWKALGSVPAFEIILHRTIWSLLFLAGVLTISRKWEPFKIALATPKVRWILLLSTIIVGGNWFLFIWAINSNQVLQTSLGYFINPLVNVLLGTLILRERLRPLQLLAVLLAGGAVLYLTIDFGRFPWIALTLGFSFALYGLIRKVAPVGALEGLTVETLFLSIPAVFFIADYEISGQGHFFAGHLSISLLLAGGALVTALPLLLFNIGARRLHLSTVGFLQYIAPSCTFILGAFVYREPLSLTQLVTFVLIWTALAMYSVDSVMVFRKIKEPPPA